MSEELATAIADAAELARLRMELEAARAERQKLLHVALAAWKLSDHINEFDGIVSGHVLEDLDQALLDVYGDTFTNWYGVRDKIKALLESPPPPPPEAPQ